MGSKLTLIDIGGYLVNDSNSASNLKSLPHGFSGDESKYSSG
jgi:hypothetical protein